MCCHAPVLDRLRHRIEHGERRAFSLALEKGRAAGCFAIDLFARPERHANRALLRFDGLPKLIEVAGVAVRQQSKIDDEEYRGANPPIE